MKSLSPGIGSGSWKGARLQCCRQVVQHTDGEKTRADGEDLAPLRPGWPVSTTEWSDRGDQKTEAYLSTDGLSVHAGGCGHAGNLDLDRS
jgi:hypothetical protein